MKNEITIYLTPHGREVRIPDDLAAKTKFTKDGMPDKRLKANAEFVAWADAQDNACLDCGRPAGAGHYDDCPVGLGVGMEITRIEPETPSPLSQYMTEIARAQTYAQRVWDGQGYDVPRAEKLRRVALALEGQGLSMEGVSL